MTDSNTNSRFVDVAIIGAGLSGLVCAQQLQQTGYRVAVVEKSRGVGGRLATRRLQGTHANHGVRYFSHQGALSEQFIQALLKKDLLQPWLAQIYEYKSGELKLVNPSYYTAPSGLTAVAKYLATGLKIIQGQRLQGLTPVEHQYWQLTYEATAEPIPPLLARSVVMAIPAPQALSILKPLLAAELPMQLVQVLESVQFDPCVSAIVACNGEPIEPLQQAIHVSDSADLAWISLSRTTASESASEPVPSVAVIQSTAAFAQHHLEAQDLNSVGQRLLESARSIPAIDQLMPELTTPVELQVHRWRYAFAQDLSVQELLTQAQPHHQSGLSEQLNTTAPLPLVCSGDWCSSQYAGRHIEGALESGLTAAYQISKLLEGEQLENTASTDWQASLPKLMCQLIAAL